MRKYLVASLGVLFTSAVSTGTHADPTLTTSVKARPIAAAEQSAQSCTCQSPIGQMQQGFQLDTAGDYARAAQLFLQTAATFPAARAFEARSLMELGQLDTAYSEATTAVQQAGQFPVTHFMLALVAERRGQLDQSTSEYRQVLAMEPNSASAHNNLGGIYYRHEDFYDARVETELALQNSTEPHGKAIALSNLAEFDELEGHLNLAEEKLNQALDAAPDDAPAYYALAVLYDVLGRTDASRTMEKYALQLDPHGSVWRASSYVWPELQTHVDALAAEARGETAAAAAQWSALKETEVSGTLHWSELKGVAETHLATLQATGEGAIAVR